MQPNSCNPISKKILQQLLNAIAYRLTTINTFVPNMSILLSNKILPTINKDI